ncbi:predicted protein [Thalassiosira pseudonana CCMP1335]|uniref:PUB domain-containing protein n=1 Tax=Thalassiosira pseudonana TaxID=35128 RepID=B8BZB4_THAPS|nr:predicted protein [Thalassiosira pseudonana CCMP1335]EED93320.1 predicted protein [Thalassiosira pseudonana CCMP1335]
MEISQDDTTVGTAKRNESSDVVDEGVRPQPTKPSQSQDRHHKPSAELASSAGVAKLQHIPHKGSFVLDNAKIDKAEAFLRNTEIHDVSSEAKREYLAKKAGMTSAEIDAAMERAAGSERLGDGMHRDEKRSSGDRMDDEDRYGRGRPLHERRNPNQYSGGRDGPGGFSLGVFCLAALRWLNGGDFVLFPPPTVNAEPLILQTQRELKSGEEHSDGGNNDEMSCSQHHQQEEEESSMIVDDDNEYADYEDSESLEDGLNKILNGSANAQNMHPNEQPTYEELVLEIRTLATAVYSFKDAQDRANRAAAAHAGKGMTDDAMDFLRQKKPPSEKLVLSNEKVAGIVSLLVEVSEYLARLKQSDTGKRDDEAIQSTTGLDSNEVDELSKSAEGNVPDEAKVIVALIEKINKVLAMFQKPEAGNETVPVVQEANTTDASPSPQPESDAPSPIASETENTKQTEPSSEDATIDPQPTSEDLDEAIRSLSNKNDTNELKAGAQMLYLYCLNISKNPTVPRYRKIYTNNNSFQKKVGNLVGAKELLSAVGFVERTNFFEWTQSDDDSETKSRLDFAGTKLKEDESDTLHSQNNTSIDDASTLPSSVASLNNAVLEAAGAGKEVLDLN